MYEGICIIAIQYESVSFAKYRKKRKRTTRKEREGGRGIEREGGRGRGKERKLGLIPSISFFLNSFSFVEVRLLQIGDSSRSVCFSCLLIYSQYHIVVYDFYLYFR
jgi:hypothetical protein